MANGLATAVITTCPPTQKYRPATPAACPLPDLLFAALVLFITPSPTPSPHPSALQLVLPSPVRSALHTRLSEQSPAPPLPPTRDTPHDHDRDARTSLPPYLSPGPPLWVQSPVTNPGPPGPIPPPGLSFSSALSCRPPLRYASAIHIPFLSTRRSPFTFQPLDVTLE